jgi:Tfp pilus assembly protein PilE
MRGLSLVDLLVIGAVLAVLVYAGTQDFGRYTERTLPAVPTPAATPGN